MKSKPLKEMTIKELEAEREHWKNKIANAPGWGGSVSAALEFKYDIERELRYRNLSFADEPKGTTHMPISEYLVIVESPLSGDVARNTEYARMCMLDCLERGEYPFASHLLYTQVLDDTNPDHRRQGMEAGWAWMSVAAKVVVYTDLGVSRGMKDGIEWASKEKKLIEFRTLPEGTAIPGPSPTQVERTGL